MGNGPRAWQRKLEALVFGGVKSLSLRNQSLGFCLPFDLVAELLEELDLAENLFVDVPREVFVLSHLTVLDLSHNKLHQLSGTSFRSLSNLKRLNVSHNLLKSIEPRVLPTGLEHMDCSFNQLTDLKFIAKLPCLRVIRAAHNSLEEMPRMPGTSPIEEMDLSFNSFRELPLCMAALPKLKTLSLRSNQLRECTVPPPTTPSSYQSLTSLNLSENALVAVPAGLGLCVRLRYLYLFRNRLTGALPSLGPGLRALCGLNVSHNFLTSIESVAELPELEWLVASHNRLTAVGAGVLALRRLEELYLQANAIRTLDARPLLQLAQQRVLVLRVLDLSHNRLEEAPALPPLPDADARVLLRGNPCEGQEDSAAYAERASFRPPLPRPAAAGEPVEVAPPAVPTAPAPAPTVAAPSAVAAPAAPPPPPPPPPPAPVPAPGTLPQATPLPTPPQPAATATEPGGGGQPSGPLVTPSDTSRASTPASSGLRAAGRLRSTASVGAAARS